MFNLIFNFKRKKLRKLLKKKVNNKLRYKSLLQELEDLYKSYKKKAHHTEQYVKDKLENYLEKYDLPTIEETYELDNIVELLNDKIESLMKKLKVLEKQKLITINKKSQKQSVVATSVKKKWKVNT